MISCCWGSSGNPLTPPTSKEQMCQGCCASQISQFLGGPLRGCRMLQASFLARLILWALALGLSSYQVPRAQANALRSSLGAFFNPRRFL